MADGVTIGDVATTCRSKNAGVALLTIDVAFDDVEWYVRARKVLSPERVGDLYRVAPDDVTCTPWDEMKTVKVTFPRFPRAGAPGDRDVYGCQQHAPMLAVSLEAIDADLDRTLSAESDSRTASARAFYRDRGLSRRVGYGVRPAILVIDMARAFCDPKYRLGFDQTSTLEAIAEILAVARDRGVPIFFTVVAYRPDGQDGGMLVKKIPALLDLGADDEAVMQVHPQIAPLDGETVILKKYSSAFFETSLGSMLVNAGIDTVILTGSSTSGCVRATATEAVSRGYRVIVPREAVADRAWEPHEANLFDIDSKYGDVEPLSDVVAYLRTLGSRK
jgi:nicotinamidase-related amidase